MFDAFKRFGRTLLQALTSFFQPWKSEELLMRAEFETLKADVAALSTAVADPSDAELDAELDALAGQVKVLTNSVNAALNPAPVAPATV